MREGVLWTNLSLRELSRRLLAMGTPASRRTIRRLLRTRTRGRRTARKQKTMGHHPERNAPLENMARLRREYEAAGDAVLAIETQDLAIRRERGFELHGRDPAALPRGCSRAADEALRT